MTNSTKEEKKIYHLSYQFKVNDPPLTEKEALAQSNEDWGSTQALFMASIIYPSDGSLSMAFLSKDGRTNNELHDSEVFKVWLLLMERLIISTDGTISDSKKDFLKSVWQCFWEDFE